MLVDNEAYLSKDIILGVINPMYCGSVPDELATMFSAAEYIKIKTDTINEYAMANISEEDIEGQKAALSESTDKLVVSIKENLPSLITEDLKMVSKKDGYYILSMDEKQALIILNSVIELIEENTDEAIEFFSGAFPNETIDEEAINELTESLLAIAKSDEWDNIKGNATLAVKGNILEQETKFRAEINHSNYDEIIKFGFESKSTVAEENVNAPPENDVIDLGDILKNALNSISGINNSSYEGNDIPVAEAYSDVTN